MEYFGQKEMDLYKSLCSNCVLQSVLDGVEVKKKSVEQEISKLNSKCLDLFS